MILKVVYVTKIIGAATISCHEDPRIQEIKDDHGVSKDLGNFLYAYLTLWNQLAALLSLQNVEYTIEDEQAKTSNYFR